MPEADQKRLVAAAVTAARLETGMTERLMAAVPPEVLSIRDEQASALGRLAKDGAVDAILQVERRTMRFELTRVAKDKDRVSSLNNGLVGVDAALLHYYKLRDDPDAYRVLDRDLSLPTNRRNNGELPDDQARKFFRAQRARLLNDKRSRYTDSETAVLDARLAALAAAERKYVALQRQVLGLAPRSR